MEENGKHKVICVIGRTCSGKTSLAREACKRLGLKTMKSFTTRPPREDETPDNSDHYFVDIPTFNYILSNEDLCGYTKINGYEYCGTVNDLKKSDVYVIDPEGLKNMRKRRNLHEFEFVEVYIVSSPKNSILRATERNESIVAYCNRSLSEDGQFRRYAELGSWQHFIYNDGSFEEGVGKMVEILKEELMPETNKENKEQNDEVQGIQGNSSGEIARSNYCTQ